MVRMYATSPGGGRLLARIFGERPARPALSCPATRTSPCHSTGARPLLLSPTPNAFLRVSVLCASPPKILLPPSPPVFSTAASLPLALAFNATLQLAAASPFLRSPHYLSPLLYAPEPMA